MPVVSLSPASSAVGIDFGAKLAGTTVICALSQSRCWFERCRKGQDADTFVRSFLQSARPSIVGIDAPVSLPGVYQHLEGCTDYFYRQADRSLRAMSPMFLGGLTARAMALKEFLTAKGIRTIEVYPAGLMRTEAKDFATYRQVKKSPSGEAKDKFLTRIAKRYRVPRAPLITSGHDLDAYLAFISTLRVLRGEAKAVGLKAEGLVML